MATREQHAWPTIRQIRVARGTKATSLYRCKLREQQGHELLNWLCCRTGERAKERLREHHSQRQHITLELNKM